MSHATGGGLEANTQRVLSDKQKLNINCNAWDCPPIFKLIQDCGKVPEEDMKRSFNLGVGMVLVIKKEAINNAEDYLKKINEPYFIIGEVF